VEARQARAWERSVKLCFCGGAVTGMSRRAYEASVHESDFTLWELTFCSTSSVHPTAVVLMHATKGEGPTPSMCLGYRQKECMRARAHRGKSGQSRTDTFKKLGDVFPHFANGRGAGCENVAGVVAAHVTAPRRVSGS
jgi:hypothetical protein